LDSDIGGLLGRVKQIREEKAPQYIGLPEALSQAKAERKAEEEAKKLAPMTSQETFELNDLRKRYACPDSHSMRVGHTAEWVATHTIDLQTRIRQHHEVGIGEPSATHFAELEVKEEEQAARDGIKSDEDKLRDALTEDSFTTSRKFARSGSIKWEPVRESQHLIAWTQWGRDLGNEIVKHAYPEPVHLQGEAGGGKSMMMRTVAHAAIGCDGPTPKDCPNHATANGFIGMEIRDLTADMVPVPAPGGGVTLVPELGVLSRMIEAGGSFGFEEINRVQNEILGRLMHLLDAGFRGWDLPEIRRHDFPVSPKFWFWATSNPPGGRYATNQLDEAIHDRFAMKVPFEKSKPICDEEVVVDGILGGDAELVQRVMHFVSDLRANDEIRLSTRRLCMFAKLISNGMDVMQAATYSVATFVDPEHKTATITTARAHFTNK
jgi:MoxR-like ATPase